jgi:hypothetical protein
MGSKTNQAAALMESDQGAASAAIKAESDQGAASAETTPKKAREGESSPVKMDINRYLGKSKIGTSLANLLRVIFKGQMATEAEWDAKTREALNRGAK